MCSLQLAGRGANKLGGVGHCVPERASLGPPRVQLHANRARGQQDAGQVGAVGCGGPDFFFFLNQSIGSAQIELLALHIMRTVLKGKLIAEIVFIYIKASHGAAVLAASVSVACSGILNTLRHLATEASAIPKQQHQMSFLPRATTRLAGEGGLYCLAFHPPFDIYMTRGAT